MDIPQTKYAKTADGDHIAYQVVRDGPVDIVFVMGWISDIELMWEEPSLAGPRTARIVLATDSLRQARHGALRSRAGRPAHLARSSGGRRAGRDGRRWLRRAVVVGVSEGGPMATLFAATYPERTIALVLFGTSARWKPAPDYPGPQSTDEEFERYFENMERLWGTREFATEEMREWGAPTLADNDHAIGWLANYLRHAASPGAAIALERMNREIDVRPALPAIHVPTLVLARDGDLAFTVETFDGPARAVRCITGDRRRGSRLRARGARGGAHDRWRLYRVVT